jgi:hypothetical protein
MIVVVFNGHGGMGREPLALRARPEFLGGRPGFVDDENPFGIEVELAVEPILPPFTMSGRSR